MPFINVKITKENGGLDTATKERLIKNLTDALVGVLGRGEKSTMVIIEEIDTDNYAVGGVTVTNMRKNGK